MVFFKLLSQQPIMNGEIWHLKGPMISNNSCSWYNTDRSTMRLWDGEGSSATHVFLIIIAATLLHIPSRKAKPTQQSKSKCHHIICKMTNPGGQPTKEKATFGKITAKLLNHKSFYTTSRHSQSLVSFCLRIWVRPYFPLKATEMRNELPKNDR